MKLAKRTQRVVPSQTLATADRAKKLLTQGHDILMLTLGQPDFVTPNNISQAAKAAIDSGKTSFYTDVRGLPELLTAIVQYFEKYYGVNYETRQILVTTGAKFALYVLFQALLDAEDEVLIPVPYWVSYADQVKLADGVPVFVATTQENDYKIKAADLTQYLTKKTKAIILNSPTNPTGMVYSEEELEAIGNWAIDNGILIIADDIYGRLVYNGTNFTPIVSISQAIYEQTVVINGLSKAYAMPGWRVGFAAGPEKVIAEMLKIVGQATSNITAVAQYAAIEALSGDQSSVEMMRSEFERRLNLLYAKVNAISGFSLRKPQGAFYFFPNVREALDNMGYQNISDFTDDLLVKAGVATVSGAAFGSFDNLRISYAQDLTVVSSAIERINEFVVRKS